MKTKKVLIFSLAYYPNFVSGAEAAIQEITERIAPSAIEFHLITHLFGVAAPRVEKIGNVHVYRVGFGGAYLSKILFVPLAAWKALSLHRIHHFDLLWAMMTYMLFPAVLAKMLGLRAPHALTLQDGDPYEKVFERWFILPFTPILNYGFRTARRIQVISKYLAEWPKRRGYRGDIVLIKNAANPNDLKETFSAGGVEQIKRELGKKEGDIFLVNTSRLVHQKGFDTIIEALPLLPPFVKLLAVGDGADAAKLKRLAEERGVSKRVIFTGRVDRSVVTLYRKASDIFVAPSRSEGLGNAFISALASRLPLITTGVGGIADYAVDGETAWLIPPDDPGALAAKVEEVLANPEKTKAISERARIMVEKEYDWDMVAVRMEHDFFTPAINA